MEGNTSVFHVDIDAFFASVEQLRNPRLAERPVAVGSGVIASCSYEARRFGLHAGMPLREARRRCPELVILEGHYPIYRCFAERVFDLCRQYAPGMESHLDEAFCDLSGTERLYRAICLRGVLPPRSSVFPPHSPQGDGDGGRPRPTGAASADAGLLPVAQELQERIRGESGLGVSVGVARNRMIAKMASKSAKPGGARRIGPEEEEEFIRPLPVKLLPGVGPRTEGVLAKLNIQTIEEMRVLSRESLRAIFGQNGILLYERCRGQDTRVIGAREIPRSISRETSFHSEVIEPDEIEGMLYYLTERAANTLRKLGLKSRTVEVKLRSADQEEAAGARTLRAATQLDAEIFEAAMNLRRSLHTRRVGLRLVGISLSKLVPDDGTRALDLWEVEGPAGAGAGAGAGDEDWIEMVLRADGKRRRALSLCRSLDKIRERFGYSSVVSGKSVHLLGKLPQDAYGYVLRTPSLTR